MLGYLAMVVAMVGAGALVLLAYAASSLVGVARRPLPQAPFVAGAPPQEHAMSRYHARWYTMALVFLAFDVEMLFMYPWTVVVVSVGWGAVVEMFGFLVVLLAGVVYAWREGALRWS